MSEFLDYEDIAPELYHAITINNDGIITGKHESKEPITVLQFYNNPWLHGDIVRGVASSSEYTEGDNIACYTEDGKHRGLVWAIENGYEEMPPNTEIIDGEMVDMNTPIENIPPTLMEKITEAQNANAKAAAAVEELRAENQRLRELIEQQMGKMLTLESNMNEVGKTLPYINIRGEK